MSKNCYLVCRSCAETMNDLGYNWAHRALFEVAHNAVRIRDALEQLQRCGIEVPELRCGGYHPISPSFLLQHGTHELYVIDEYGAEWPCACKGDHTGECRT